jgi:formylmethanofuran dehydrogenase subunit C
MSITLTLRKAPPARVDASPLTPERLTALNAGRVAGLRLRCGRETVEVGELFEINGYVGDGTLTLAGDLRLLDGIGAGMTRGRLAVGGDCGDRLGAGMRGGELTVDGGVGAYAGCEMAGGVLRISGDSGARLGGAYPGARAGMTGGEIVVSGHAGEEAGAGMRRGLVAVGGRAGDGAGLRMLAGTVIALGGFGNSASVGQGNKRGTLVSGVAVEPNPLRYAFAARYRPLALTLQLRRLRALGLDVADAPVAGRWARWSGDTTELGRGEIVIFDEEESQ